MSRSVHHNDYVSPVNYLTIITEKKSSKTVFYRRYLLRLILLSCFLKLSVYLWINEFEIIQPIFIKVLRLEERNETNNNVSLADLIRAGIEPFPNVTLHENDFINGINMLQKFPWWDLWNGDSNCNRHQVHLLKPGTQPTPGAFVSFPGSGNTWLRTLLMAITGVYITSVYANENRFYRPDDYYETHSIEGDTIPVNCGCSLLQKTHDFSLLAKLSKRNLTRTLGHYQGKGIFIIRNPFKAIQSFRNFKFAGLEGSASSKVFLGDDWDKFVSRSISRWERLAKVWITGLNQGGIVYYENLCHNTKLELKRVMKMIGFKYDKDRFECVLRHSQDNSMKRRIHNKFGNPYTASQILLIHKAIANVQRMLNDRQLDPLPVEYYDFYDTTLENVI